MRRWSLQCNADERCTSQTNRARLHAEAAVWPSRQIERSASASVDDFRTGVIRLNLSDFSRVCPACRTLLIQVTAADLVILEGSIHDVGRDFARMQSETGVLIDFVSLAKALPEMEHRGEDIRLIANGQTVPGAIYELADDLRGLIARILNDEPR